MQREFSISTGMKIFYCLLGAGIVIFSFYLLSIPKNAEVSNLVYLLPLFFTGVGVLFISNGLRRKVIIEDGKFINIGVFTTQELLISDIKGYRLGNKGLYLESASSANSKITINNYNDFSDSWELLQHIKTNFKDLDEADLKQQESGVLQDTSLGFTSEERKGKLDKAKTIATLYNVIGAIVAVAALVVNKPVLIVITIVYPLVSIIVMLTGNDLIKFISNKKRSVYAFVFLGFLIPAMVLLVKVNDYHLFKFDNLWLPLLLSGLVVFALLFMIGLNRSMGSVAGQAAVMLVAGLMFSFGSITQINCLFDKSPLKIYHAEVLGHHITHGRHTDYYLYLTPWGPCHEQKEVTVSSKMYANTNVGDTLNVDFKPGLLNIPWFEVTKQ